MLRYLKSFAMLCIMAFAMFSISTFAATEYRDTFNFLTQSEAPASDTVTAPANFDISSADITQAMALRTDNPFYSLATVERMTFLMPIDQRIGVPCSCTMIGMKYRYMRLTKDSPPECVDDCGPGISYGNSLPTVTLKNGIRLTRFGPSWRG